MPLRLLSHPHTAFIRRGVLLATAVVALGLAACRPAAEDAPALPEPAATPAAAPAPVDILRGGVATAGWKLAGEPEVFEGEGIYEYMNGEGEIPVACGYHSLATADLTCPAQAGARIELFAMGNSANAFGLYSLRREPADERLDLTHPAVIAPGQLIGWKGAYTYIVRADDPEALEEDTLQVLAKGIEQQIAEPGELPELLRRLPSEGLLAGSSRYFHGKFALDTIWFEPHNVLQVSALTEGAAAEYTTPAGQVLLIDYPPQAKPESALAAWSKLHGATDDGSGHWLSSDGKSGAMLLDGRVAVVMECATKADVVAHLVRLATSTQAVAAEWPPS